MKGCMPDAALGAERDQKWLNVISVLEEVPGWWG